MKFDDGAGTKAADSSGRAHDGVLSGGAAWSSAGKHGGAISLDGIDDMVTIGDHADLDLTNALTLEAWVKPDTLKAWQTIALKEAPSDPAYALYATGGGTAQANAWIGARGVYSPSKLQANKWVHVALTYDGSKARVYLDGVLKATGTGVPSALASTGVLRIGGNGLYSGEQFDGLIDDLRIYKRALSATEIVAEMDVATAKAASARKRVKAPKVGRACLSPGSTKAKPKLTKSLKRKKVKRCADKPHKAQKRRK
jgi:hypothetical protein